jgi:gluconolactonase
VPTPQDWVVTNLCFAGPDRRKALVTLSGAGLLIELDWARPGLKLAY